MVHRDLHGAGGIAEDLVPIAVALYSVVQPVGWAPLEEGAMGT